MKTVILYGATGSIGESSLNIIRENQDKFQLFAVLANQNIAKLLQICREFKPQFAVINDFVEIDIINEFHKLGTKLIYKENDNNPIDDFSQNYQADIAIMAISGAKCLLPTLNSTKQVKRLLIASKEAFVMAGELVLKAAKEHKCEIFSIDSEHNGVFQCLPEREDKQIQKITITASGGSFRDLHYTDLQNVSLQDALKHPTWNMGAKITIDSATMMNKALEVIEAARLFSLQKEQIEVVLHKQSIIHAFVEFVDNSVLAHLSTPNMQLPIANALTYPKKINSQIQPLNLSTMKLDFESVEDEKYKCLKLAYQALEKGNNYCVALNAINEVLVEKFLQEKIKFIDIINFLEIIFNELQLPIANSLEQILKVDKLAREQTEHFLSKQ